MFDLVMMTATFFCVTFDLQAQELQDLTMAYNIMSPFLRYSLGLVKGRPTDDGRWTGLSSFTCRCELQ